MKMRSGRSRNSSAPLPLTQENETGKEIQDLPQINQKEDKKSGASVSGRGCPVCGVSESSIQDLNYHMLYHFTELLLDAKYVMTADPKSGSNPTPSWRCRLCTQFVSESRLNTAHHVGIDHDILDLCVEEWTKKQEKNTSRVSNEEDDSGLFMDAQDPHQGSPRLSLTKKIGDRTYDSQRPLESSKVCRKLNFGTEGPSPREENPNSSQAEDILSAFEDDGPASPFQRRPTCIKTYGNARRTSDVKKESENEKGKQGRTVKINTGPFKDMIVIKNLRGMKKVPAFEESEIDDEAAEIPTKKPKRRVQEESDESYTPYTTKKKKVKAKKPSSGTARKSLLEEVLSTDGSPQYLTPKEIVPKKRCRSLYNANKVLEESADNETPKDGNNNEPGAGISVYTFSELDGEIEVFHGFRSSIKKQNPNQETSLPLPSKPDAAAETEKPIQVEGTNSNEPSRIPTPPPPPEPWFSPARQPLTSTDEEGPQEEETKRIRKRKAAKTQDDGERDREESTGYVPETDEEIYRGKN